MQGLRCHGKKSLFGFYSKCQKQTTDLVAMWRKDANDMGKWESCIS